jgi:tetratricopeptide (TPR) repeat protein
MNTLKKRHWLDLAEYASLLGLGVGSVASFLSTQFLYTSAPLSLLVLLNLANRRRLEQVNEQNTTIALAAVDQRFTRQVELLNQQVQALPTVEQVGSLKKSLLVKNREELKKLSSDITEIQQEMHQRLATLEQQDVSSIRPEVRQIQEQYLQLTESIAQLSGQLQRLSSTNRVEGLEDAIAQLKTDLSQLQNSLQDLSGHTRPNLVSLQDQITHFNRQFQKLPPPIDPSALKQEVGELVKVVSDLVPKRDVAVLVNEVKALQQQQEILKQSLEAIESAALNLKRQFSHSSPSRSGLPQDPLTLLGMNLEAANSSANSSNGKKSESSPMAAGIYPEIQAMVASYFDNLRSQITTVQQFTQSLEQQHKQLRTQVNQLPQTLDVVALQRQLHDLAETMTLPDSNTNSFQARIKEILHREFQDVNQRLQVPTAPHYEFIFDLNADMTDSDATSGSRAVLEEALEKTQKRLILILPWSSQCGLDATLMHKLETFLQSNKQLDLGWCHQADPDQDRFLSNINRGWVDPRSQNQLQDTLNKLLLLKRTYPDRFRFKILGTGENFLVSDQSFAVMGIHDTLTTNTVLADMQLKLRTNDSKVVKRLIDRFDNPVLDVNDVTAYWNRAVTRSDLGDKEGAIADYTHVLEFNFQDAITYNHRGVVRYEQGDVAGALIDFDRSIELQSQQVSALCNRGFVRAEQGDWLGAVADYSLAIQNQPNSAIAYFYRGIACQKLDDHQGAVMDFSAALRLVPDSAVAHYYRGITYQKLGNHIDAIPDLEIAVKRFAEQGNKPNTQKALRTLLRSRQTIADQSPPQAVGEQVGEQQKREPAAAVQQPPTRPLPSATPPRKRHPETLADLFHGYPDYIESNGYAAPVRSTDAVVAIERVDSETLADFSSRF